MAHAQLSAISASSGIAQVEPVLPAMVDTLLWMVHAWFRTEIRLTLEPMTASSDK